jgi:hypothetical protein
MDAFDPDAFLAQTNQVASQPKLASVESQTAVDSSGFDPDVFIKDLNEQQYGTPSQQIKTGLEGAAKGVLGPAAPYIETKVLKVKPEDIRLRAETNPITHGLGEAAGLLGSAMTGFGEAAAMTKAGELATGAVGLANLAKDASLGYKVGSSVVQQAAEMAVLQGSDEISKQILKDPDASAETAISNIGLAAALGGAGGAIITGAASPLWQATAGPKVEQRIILMEPAQLYLK